VDYNFITIAVNLVVGTITLTVFPINADPQGGGGTVVGNFNFTGQGITVPLTPLVWSEGRFTEAAFACYLTSSASPVLCSVI
jgi:hypothetical protein